MRKSKEEAAEVDGSNTDEESCSDEDIVIDEFGSDIEDENEELVASEVGEEEETLPFVVRTRYGPPGQIS